MLPGEWDEVDLEERLKKNCFSKKSYMKINEFIRRLILQNFPVCKLKIFIILVNEILSRRRI